MRSLIIATTLMLLSSVFLPAYSAGVPANASWGFEYDWSYLDQDTEYLSSVNLDDIVTIIEEADEKTEHEIRRGFDRLVNKLLHPPLESLRDESQHGTPHGLLAALKKLFQLKDG